VIPGQGAEGRRARGRNTLAERSLILYNSRNTSGVLEPLGVKTGRRRREGKVMLDEALVEQRLAALERRVAEIQQRLAGMAASGNWLEKITGSISDQEAFLEALEIGRAFRQADWPLDEAGSSD
jgi:hypothetical protein